MVSLASLDDWMTITGCAPTDPTNRVARLLEMASDAVLAGAHGQEITSATRTTRIRPVDGIAYLPQRPVTAVVEVLDGDGALIDPSGYRWEPGGNRRPARLIRRVSGTDSYWTGEITVTYTAGWVQIPGPIVAAVVSMARAALDGGGGPAIERETTGPFSVTVAEPQLSNMALTASTRALLDQLCGVNAPWSVPTPRDLP